MTQRPFNLTASGYIKISVVMLVNTVTNHWLTSENCSVTYRWFGSWQKLRLLHSSSPGRHGFFLFFYQHLDVMVWNTVSKVTHDVIAIFACGFEIWWIVYHIPYIPLNMLFMSMKGSFSDNFLLCLYFSFLPGVWYMKASIMPSFKALAPDVVLEIAQVIVTWVG